MHHAEVGTRQLAYKQKHVRTQASFKEGRGSQRNGLGMLVGFVSVEVGTVGWGCEGFTMQSEVDSVVRAEAAMLDAVCWVVWGVATMCTAVWMVAAVVVTSKRATCALIPDYRLQPLNE